MPTSISSQYGSSQYLQSRQRDRQDNNVYGDRLGTDQSVQERAEEIRKEREEKKELAESSHDQQDKNDYKSLIDRVADQEAKKAKLSAYTQRQQALLEQVEKTVSPQDQENSYRFKV